MFVYQNKDGNICVTFEDVKPVEAPEYVIAIDDVAKKLYMVSGTIEKMPESEDEPVEETVVIDVPQVEELDNVVENDHVSKDATTVVVDTNVPKLDDIREKDEQEPVGTDNKVDVVTPDSEGAPSVDELDDVVENDNIEGTAE